MQSDPALLVGAAFALGFVGSAHCVAMCGGIAGALGLAARRGGGRAWPRALLHSLARTASYAAIGAGVGAVGGLAEGVLGWGLWLRGLAGAVILGQGLRVLGFDPGFARLERAGLGLWRRASPLASGVGAPGGRLRALAIGALWGLMPCGLVYTAAATAAATGSARDGALWMAAFGLGTLPAMAATALAAGGFLARVQRGGARRLAGVVLVAFGLMALSGVFAGMPTHATSATATPACHAVTTGPPPPRPAGSPGSATSRLSGSSESPLTRPTR